MNRQTCTTEVLIINFELSLQHRSRSTSQKTYFHTARSACKYNFTNSYSHVSIFLVNLNIPLKTRDKRYTNNQSYAQSPYQKRRPKRRQLSSVKQKYKLRNQRHSRKIYYDRHARNHNSQRQQKP
jgi:hypothetical protein